MSRLKEILASSSFRQRLFSGVILVVLALLVLSKGGVLLFGVLLACSLIGIYELCRVVSVERKLAGVLAYLGGTGIYVLLWNGLSKYDMALMTGLLLVLLADFVITYPKYRTEQITVSFFSVFYVAVMFSYIYRVRIMPDGDALVWLIVLSSWGCDTCAYVFGMLFGRKHFAPVLSPKKTVEGAVGGFLGAALLGFVFACVFEADLKELRNPQLACAFACGVAGLLSMIGDLAASAIKRDHEVKDYGRLIPGHGGILDRFDSMLFTAPAIYFALYFADRVF